MYTELMEISDRYAWLFRELPVIAALMDVDGCFIDVSDEWVRRLGYSREEMRGRRPESIATPESIRHILEEHLPQFRRTGRLDHVSVEFLDKSGEKVMLLATTTMIDTDALIEDVHSLSVFTELSDRARLEQRYRDLYQSTPAMLHTVDDDGRITAVSDHWLEKLGYTREEVIGRSILDFLSEEARGPLLDGRVRDVIKAGTRKNLPRQMVTRKGELIDVVMSSRTELDQLTGHTKLFVASKDVTERNRTELKLREAYEEIERLKDKLERERDYLREEVEVAMNFGQIVGQSPALLAMSARIEAVADTPASVLIIGETGSGKELVARAIHARSGRSDKSLVKVNCASIPAELFESEFFGHVRGAFTGAHQDRIGRFQLADGGTLFLDEVGEIPLGLQSKLLRVLQEKEFERVGEAQSRSVDVRVIAATNKDLEKAVEVGEFREDLYYRLGVFPVRVPPLRKRGDDVIMLAIHILEQVCRDFGRETLKLTRSQVDALRVYSWPGNVRELKNVIERAVILSDDQYLRLDLSLPEAHLNPPSVDESATVSGDTSTFISDEAMRERVRHNLIAALKHADWRVAGEHGAARLLGLKPSTLTDRMHAMNIKRPASGRHTRSHS
ncbi:MAG: Fis family transcriptional regulator [Chromatiales bacterium]|nr:Fis family transcriptional regulator [Chromatiales bacterium]